MSLLNSASLCVTPNAYKEGTLYSVIPNTSLGDMTVVRATTATRVNSAGLVELVPRNLLTYSQDFSNAAWTKQNVTLTANSIANPIDGIVDAYRVNITSTGVTGLYQEIIKGAGNYTVSVFVKKAETQYVNLGFIYNAGRWSGTQFDLNSGTILINNANTYTFVNSTITDLGNGWFKLTHNATIDTPEAYPFFSPSNALWTSGEPRQALTGNNTTGAYFFGMQAELFSTATEYFPTTTRLNIPRLDYSNGSCPSLLVEPQRTNLVVQSNNMTTWANGGGTMTNNATTSPDGTNNALSFDNSADCSTFAGASNGVHSWSVYVKQGTSATTSIDMSDGVTGDVITTFTFATKTFSGTSAGGSWTSPSTSYIECGNGWFRITLIATKNAGSSIGHKIIPSGSGYTYVYGAQLEAGSYPTSYIPTTSAAVTRNTDVISKTGISSLIGQTEGTILWDIYIETPTATDNENILNIDNGFFGNTFYISKSASSTIAAEMYSGGVVQASFTKTGIVKGRYKCAFAYANNNTAFFVNGVQVGSTDTSCSVPATSRFQMGLGALGASTGLINSAILFPTRLTNAELISLTT